MPSSCWRPPGPNVSTTEATHPLGHHGMDLGRKPRAQLHQLGPVTDQLPQLTDGRRSDRLRQSTPAERPTLAPSQPRYRSRSGPSPRRRAVAVHRGRVTFCCTPWCSRHQPPGRWRTSLTSNRTSETRQAASQHTASRAHAPIGAAAGPLRSSRPYRWIPGCLPVMQAERSAERAARTAGAPPGSRPGLDENGEIANRLVPACPSELDRDVTSAIGSLGGVWCTGRPAAVAFLAARSALLAGRAGHPTLGSRRGCHAQRRDGRAKRTRGGVDDICPGSLLMQAMAQRTGGTVLASA